ncbi:hypothetical protein [Candidatus Enterovibrio escicola]|uniref:Uncharacterized protein n=1 Tax=Candidatus Enterovibrio escicola TaxID=1927127 RepID=A0A2A5T039_9GAMM|nr:hypothetical protein [Candidatus Enterovibrio escacola]PCS21478.1 hypothetical protein BTN49_3018 [Candidatus Enterovibrio escacola]
MTATVIAGARFVGLINKFNTEAAAIATAILAKAKSRGASREHSGDIFNDDIPHCTNISIEEREPSLLC